MNAVSEKNCIRSFKIQTRISESNAKMCLLPLGKERNGVRNVAEKLDILHILSRTHTKQLYMDTLCKTVYDRLK